MPTTEDHKENEVYEIGYLVLPSVSEDALSDVVARVKKAVTDSEGSEIASEDPLMFDLAYTMSKVVGVRKYVADEAYIGWIKFEAEPSKAPVIKAAVEKMEEILRMLLIKAPRDTAFTFEGARKAIEAEEAAEAEKAASLRISAEPEAPKEPVVE